MLYRGTALAVAIGLALAWTASAPASQPVPDSANAAPGAKKDTSRRMCRSVVLTGTRMAKRYCRTQEEWEFESEKARRFHEEGQQNSRRDGEFNSPN
jgi:hypothetical protein